MRLLSKNEIVLKKGDERKLEIEEGAKLARKIDVLRETVAKEEANLTKFRDASLRNIRIELDKLAQDKAFLIEEVQSLKAQRHELLAPLDSTLATEWERVNKEREFCEKLITELGIRLVQLEEDTERNKKTLELLEIEEARIQEKSKQADKGVRIATRDKALAETRTQEAEQHYSKLCQMAEEEQKRVDSQSKLLQIREQDCELKAKSLESRELALKNKEKFINDKYETLQRTINYVNNGKRKSN